MEVNEKDLKKFTKDYREMQRNHKILTEELSKALSLLDKSLYFMNTVPNNKYGNNYEICNEINEYIHSLNKKLKPL